MSDEEEQVIQVKAGLKDAHAITIESYNSLIKLAKQFPKQIREISDFQYIKIIGRGGFGEVWLGRDLRTGKFAAIKELNSSKLIGRNLSSFIREVSVSCRVRNSFVVPFLGYTLEPPYCIITEYMENGTLFNYVNKKHRKFALSGTHLTIIAAGIAYAMADCHRLHIMHRDLKAANILLDSKRLPRLCDFGISRNCTRNRSYTAGIGTIPYMAPEAINSRKYDEKIDVYSYGILIDEMIMGRNPYVGMTIEEVMEGVTKRGLRPDLDRSLQNETINHLIDKCWEQDPDKRPTFSQIFQSFRVGKIYFKDTDHKIVSEFLDSFVEHQIKVIQRQRMRRSGSPPHSQSSRSFVDVDALITRMEQKIKEEEQAQATDAEGAMEEFDDEIELPFMEGINVSSILQDPKSPNFNKALDLVFNSITKKQFRNLWQILLPHFLDEEDISLVALLMSKILQLIDRDQSFFDAFANAHAFSALPLKSDQLRQLTFTFVAKLIDYNPSLLQASLFRAIGSFVMNMPTESLQLFQFYVSKDKISLQVLDIIISFARSFLHSDYGSQYLIILRYCIETNQSLYEARFNKIWPIFTAFSRSNDQDIALEAFLCMARFYEGTKVIPFDAIAKWQSNHSIARASLSLLLKCNNFPVSRTLTRFLVEQAQTKTKAFYVLFKFASQSNEHARLCVINNRWMQFLGKEPVQFFLLIFSNPALRQDLCGSGFPIFCRHCAKSKDAEIITLLPTIFHRVVLTSQSIQPLVNAGFFQFIRESVVKLDQPKVYKACSMILDTFARVSYIEVFKKFIPLLVKMLKIPEASGSAFSVLVTFTCHKELAQKLANPQIMRFVQSLQKSPAHEKMATTFINNVSPFLPK